LCPIDTLKKTKLNYKDDTVFIAPNAYVMGDVRLEEEASVWYGAILRGDTDKIVVGKRSNIQDGVIIHADYNEPTIIGEDVTVGHGAIVHGATVGDCSLIGMRATILNRAKIGRCCIIGANALVTEGMEIPDFSMAVGIPAKIVKQLPDSIEAMLKHSATHYVQEAKNHAKGKYPLIK
jgi:carbonic anhydrase/acetyltransferase-like protein (isoleucine patch superfamily)